MSVLQTRARVTLASACATAALFNAAASYGQQHALDISKEVIGNQGCRYQAESIVWDPQLEREGLLPKLAAFEEKLKRGKETYQPEPNQEVQVMVVACTTLDDPVVWSRPQIASIVLVTLGYLKHLK